MKKQLNQYNFFKNVSLDEDGCMCVDGLDDLINVIDDLIVDINKLSGGTTNNITNNFNTTNNVTNNNVTNNTTNNYNKPSKKPNKPCEEEIVVIKGCKFKYKKKEPKKLCNGDGRLTSVKVIKNKKIINIGNVEEKFRWWCSYSKTPGKCFDKLMADNTPIPPKKIIKTDGIKIKNKKSSSIIIKG